MNIYGYYRSEKKEVDDDEIIKKMLQLGIEEQMIYVDKDRGNEYERPKLKLLEEKLNSGDLIYIQELSNLGKTFENIINQWKYITDVKLADIACISEGGNFDSRILKSNKELKEQFFKLLDYADIQDKRNAKKRQMVGLEKGPNDANNSGRPKINLETISEKQRQVLVDNYTSLKNKKLTAVKFMELLELKKNTFYKILKEYEESLNKNPIAVKNRSVIKQKGIGYSKN